MATEQGKIVGTIAYMSPEQLSGERLDHRTDIFSFGVMLYQMTTGELPFKGESWASVISAILRDEPSPIATLEDNLLEGVAHIVQTCLAKSPEERYQTVQDLQDALAGVEDEGPSDEAPRKGHRGTSRGLSLQIGILVASSLVLAWLLTNLVRHDGEAVISGRVVDENGRPLSRAIVIAGFGDGIKPGFMFEILVFNAPGPGDGP